MKPSLPTSFPTAILSGLLAICAVVVAPEEASASDWTDIGGNSSGSNATLYGAGTAYPGSTIRVSVTDVPPSDFVMFAVSASYTGGASGPVIGPALFNFVLRSEADGTASVDFTSPTHWALDMDFYVVAMYRDLSQPSGIATSNLVEGTTPSDLLQPADVPVLYQESVEHANAYWEEGGSSALFFELYNNQDVYENDPVALLDATTGLSAVPDTAGILESTGGSRNGRYIPLENIFGMQIGSIQIFITYAGECLVDITGCSASGSAPLGNVECQGVGAKWRENCGPTRHCSLARKQCGTFQGVATQGFRYFLKNTVKGPKEDLCAECPD
jgi:hypothetical protein